VLVSLAVSAHAVCHKWQNLDNLPWAKRIKAWEKKVWLNNMADWKIQSIENFRYTVSQIELLKNVRKQLSKLPSVLGLLGEVGVNTDVKFEHWGNKVTLAHPTTGACFDLAIEKVDYGITFSPYDKKKEAEVHEKHGEVIGKVQVPGNPTLSMLFCKLARAMGNKFTGFDAKNNCQDFSLAVYNALGIDPTREQQLGDVRAKFVRNNSGWATVIKGLDPMMRLLNKNVKAMTEEIGGKPSEYCKNSQSQWDELAKKVLEEKNAKDAAVKNKDDKEKARGKDKDKEPAKGAAQDAIDQNKAKVAGF